MTEEKTPPSEPIVYVSQKSVARDSFLEAAQQQAFLFYKLGITQIVLSIVTLAIGISLTVYSVIYANYYYPYFYYDWFGQIGTGIWTACFFFTSGLLGVLSGQRRNRCLVVSSLVMAIFSALAAGTLLGLEIAGAINSTNYTTASNSPWDVSLGLHLALTVLAVAEIVISIVHASYCCNCNCCDSSQSCCMPTEQSYPGPVTYTYANSNAFVQLPTNQVISNNYAQGVPNQPGILSMQPGVVPTQPGVVPVQHGFVPMQHGFVPMQTRFVPMQTGVVPEQLKAMQQATSETSIDNSQPVQQPISQRL